MHSRIEALSGQLLRNIMLTKTIDIAKEAGIIIREGFNSNINIEFKTDAANLVTNIDKSAEKIIVDFIKKEYPTHSILAEESGEKRIPIMIGAFEAQAIALHLEELKPPRPLTHDLFRSFAKSYSIELKEVFINKLEEGIFYSELVFFNGEDIVKIDSRTSDAVALALRFKCPIFTSSEILDKAGIIMEDKTKDIVDLKSESKKKKEGFSAKSDSDLEKMLNEAVESEDYERASKIRDELRNRGKGV